MKLIGLMFGAVLAAQPFSVSVSHAQTVTRPGLAPGSSWSFTRSPQGGNSEQGGNPFQLQPFGRDREQPHCGCLCDRNRSSLCLCVCEEQRERGDERERPEH